MANDVQAATESTEVRTNISALFINIDGLDVGESTEKRTPENKEKIVTNTNAIQVENVETKQIINANLDYKENPNKQQK